MSRPNQILSIVLAVQLVLAAVLFFPRGTEETIESGSALLSEIAPTDVSELSIHDAEGNSVRLLKNVNGDWVLPDADNYPVQSERVTDLLTRLQSLRANRLIVESSSSHRRLKVDDEEYERLVEFTTGDETETLYIGSSTGANATHMRVQGSDQVYLVGGLAAWEVAAQPSGWVDTQYFSVSRDQLISLTVENENGVFEFVQVDGEWTLADLAENETFNPDSINTLLNQATSVRMTAPLGTDEEDDYGLDEPQAIITLTVEETVEPEASEDATPEVGPLVEEDAEAQTPEDEDAEPEPTAEPEIVEKTYTLRLGAQIDEEEGYYVLISSESDYYVTVARVTAEAYLNVARDELVTVAEEETDADEAADETPEADVTEEADSADEAVDETPEADVTEEADSADEAVDETPEADVTEEADSADETVDETPEVEESDATEEPAEATVTPTRAPTRTPAPTQTPEED